MRIFKISLLNILFDFHVYRNVSHNLSSLYRNAIDITSKYYIRKSTALNID